jgi:hypothetical protein
MNWSTAMAISKKSFTVQRSEDGMNWQAIGTMDGAGSSTAQHTYSFTDKLPAKSVSWYRLMLTAFDGENTYSIVITVGKCGMDIAGTFALYPNPSTGTFTLSYTGDRTLVSSIEIFNDAGEQVYASSGFQAMVDLSKKPSGEYFVQIHLPFQTINLDVLVVK